MSSTSIFIITDSGCEDACVKEIERWSIAPVDVAPNVLTLEGTLDDAIALGYHLQTARRVLMKLAPVVRSLDDIEGLTPDLKLIDDTIGPDATFKVEAEVLSMRATDAPRVDSDLVSEREDESPGLEDDNTTDTNPTLDSDSESNSDTASDSDTTSDIASHLDNDVDNDVEGSDDEDTVSRAATSGPYLTQELIEAVGDWAHERLRRKVNLKSPDVIIAAVTNPDGKIHIGIDVVGIPLSKREYRVMLSRRSLKATVAAATVIYAGIDAKQTILDPLADDGALAIESALYLSRTSPRHYATRFAFHKFPIYKGKDWMAWKASQDKHVAPEKIERILAYCGQLREMKAIRTNAKLAGVEKYIHGTKVDVDWMDLKLEENGVDCIVTAPIPGGKSISPKEAEKHTNNLFNQAAYVLKRRKQITCITEKPDELLPHAKEHGFSQIARHDILMGKRLMSIVTFENGKGAKVAKK